ncbi:glycosyl transferase [Actinotalea sp. K2]|uniref:glycosyl transferase n=1 Tax=Actinotalea sp. K2 TaxID=2939438 RepID=UPI0020173FE0|nr:glycosyl transferase [Actinotalea sp. K2]MCL3861285.1 glycosyl transferase [Actinotalea sp. K2]
MTLPGVTTAGEVGRAVGDGDRPLVVLQSFHAVRPTTNPYLIQLLASLGAGATVRTFTWRTALVGRWDVLHVHWPELIFRRDGRIRSALGMVLTLVLLVRLRVRRGALVRTLHNEVPHESRGWFERRVLALLDRCTTLWICLNGVTEPPRPGPVVRIPIGGYAGWFAEHVVPSTVRGRVLTFGLIRPYKGVEDLVAAFRAVPVDHGLSLSVAGRPSTAQLADAVRAGADGDQRIRLSLDHVSDAALVHEVGEAELVVLPYRHMQNSSAALLALSLGRPILVPANPLNADLAEEVGRDWVHLFDGAVTAEHLVRALGDARERPASSVPDLSAREWSSIGSAHLDAFARAVRLASRHEGRRAGRGTGGER